MMKLVNDVYTVENIVVKRNRIVGYILANSNGKFYLPISDVKILEGLTITNAMLSNTEYCGEVNYYLRGKNKSLHTLAGRISEKEALEKYGKFKDYIQVKNRTTKLSSIPDGLFIKIKILPSNKEMLLTRNKHVVSTITKKQINNIESMLAGNKNIYLDLISKKFIRLTDENSKAINIISVTKFSDTEFNIFTKRDLEVLLREGILVCYTNKNSQPIIVTNKRVYLSKLTSELKPKRFFVDKFNAYDLSVNQYIYIDVNSVYHVDYYDSDKIDMLDIPSLIDSLKSNKSIELVFFSKGQFKTIEVSINRQVLKEYFKKTSKNELEADNKAFELIKRFNDSIKFDKLVVLATSLNKVISIDLKQKGVFIKTYQNNKQVANQ